MKLLILQRNSGVGLWAGQGDDVQVEQIAHGVAHQVHSSRGVHGSPCDVLEKIEAYLGGLTSSLKDALVLLFVCRVNL